MKDKPCMLEQLIQRTEMFKLVHDGQNNPGQFQFEEVNFYTKKYQLIMDGELCSTIITFKYDKRSHFADFEIYNKEPAMKAGREKMTLNLDLEERKINESK